MKRHSRATGEPARSRRPKSAKSKSRDAPKAASNRPSRSGAETEVVQLRRELHEAREQQTAAGEILASISGSTADTRPVFEAILDNLLRLFGTRFALVLLVRDNMLHVAGIKGALGFEKLAEHYPLPLDDRLLPGKAILAGHALQITPIIGNPDAPPSTQKLALDFGYNALLSVPLIHEGKAIGALNTAHRDPIAFTDKQVALIRSFAAQAVIAIENARLLNELRQRTIDLTERTADLTEALEQQTATSEVLQVISSSPGDLQPVFAAMLEKAARICDATFGDVFSYDDGNIRLVASHNTPVAFVEALKQFAPTARPLTSFGKRLMATKSAVQVADLAADEDYIERNPPVVAAVELGGARTVLVVPMLKEDELIGGLVLNRQEVRPFTDKQIELVKNFASQAVIAIENARLLNELRKRTTDLTERTADLTEALEQQTATSEVLQVISSSPGDLRPVFATMLENAVRICEATFGDVFERKGDALHLIASHKTPAAFVEALKTAPRFPSSTFGERMMTTRSAVHVADLAADEDHVGRRVPIVVAAVELGGTRTVMGVPMLKENELLGTLVLNRQEVRPFTDKQIALVTNFAAQAVIAIENARLLNELRQSLERQTATSEVLQVISTSPGDLEPVFEAMVASAVRICDAAFGNIYRWDGETLRLVASHNVPPAYAEARRRLPVISPGTQGPISRMIANKTAVHVLDLAADPGYTDERAPSAVAAVELGGVRTFLAVPMLRERELIGAFMVSRQEVRPFTDKQIELVKNFAAQAVIAIENARLLNELRQRTTDLTDALDQQTAASEVLEAISSFAGELDPVFRAILTNATRLCEAKYGNLYLFADGAFHLVSAGLAFERLRGPPIYPAPGTGLGRMVRARAAVQIADVVTDKEYPHDDDDPLWSAVQREGIRTLLCVPMIKEDRLIGAVIIFRQEVRPFTDKQIELVKNFAAQAVIAIENARLLKELRERTSQLEAQSQKVVKLNQQLEQRVTDQVGEIERMGRLRRFLPPQVADLIVASGAEKQLESHRREITALFCDLRGFTGFSESADPEDVITLLRDYHAAVGEKIIKYSGTLERYAGDGVMVVFNDPVPVERPALQAVQMALETREAMRALTEKWRELGHDVGFGIGIAHGYATLGTIGFEGRFDYAAIGTVSNVASRLCDEAKPGQILISPRVFTAVKDAVTVEPVGEFTLKGIGRPLAAYNVLAAISA